MGADLDENMMRQVRSILLDMESWGATNEPPSPVEEVGNARARPSFVGSSLAMVLGSIPLTPMPRRASSGRPSLRLVHF